MDHGAAKNERAFHFLPPAVRYATLSAEEALERLGVSQGGLSERQVEERLLKFGLNRLPRLAAKHWYQKLGQSFVHLFALLLWVGALLAWLAGLPQLAVAIVVVIVVNGFFSYWQEYQAERAAEALEALLPRQVMVRRSGEKRLILAENVTRGDVLILAEGDAVPADARVIRSEQLRLDLSSLTGESRPIPRSTGRISGEVVATTSLPNLVFAGTMVAKGTGEAVVFAVGSQTEFGRIAELTQVQDDSMSPLQKEIRRITRIVAVLSTTLGLTFFVLGTFVAKLPVEAALIFAIGIIVANVPEGLLPTLTLSLAVSAKRMAHRKALMKKLAAVETLGAATIILTDKTGTLTENEMTVREIWLAGKYLTVTGVGYDPAGSIEAIDDGDGRTAVTRLLQSAALCCDARLVPPTASAEKRWTAIGDPTEAAILVAAEKIGLTADTLAGWKRLAELPFDSLRRRMTTIQRIDGSSIACVKGALGEILSRCTRVAWDGSDLPISEVHDREIRAAHDRLANKGQRVLAIASRELDAQADEVEKLETADVERDLTLLGLISMEDPPRVEVPSAVAACRQAGIRVVMVTGDDPLTAAAIGREIGLHDTVPHLITGPELDKLKDDQLESLILTEEVLFARIAPQQKLRLLEACQRQGHVVAVTGDGVNDAPALRKADIGVAMGATGTDVAREASDMILTDDNFAAIVSAIEEGRTVYENIRKFVVYVFVSNASEMMPFVAFVLFRVPLPLTIMQVLAVDIGTDLFPALALGAEKPEPDIMRRAPRRRTDGLLNVKTLVRAYAWLGMIQGSLALSGFFFAQWLAGWRPGADLISSGEVYVVTTTVTFAGIVMGQVGNAFCCRSERRSVFELGFFSNRSLLWAIGAEVALTLSLIYVPKLAELFNMAALRTEHWLLIVTFGVILLMLEEIRKAFVRYTTRERLAR